MIKTFFEEFLIMILLCIGIIIIMAVVFYDYNPMNKNIPLPIAYTTSENVKTALEEYKETTGNEFVFEKEKKVYTIDEERLEEYRRTKSYNPGKTNPFANLQEGTSGGATGGNAGGTSGNAVTNTSPVVKEPQSNSGTTFYNDTGRK